MYPGGDINRERVEFFILCKRSGRLQTCWSLQYRPVSINMSVFCAVQILMEISVPTLFRVYESMLSMGV